MGRTGAKRKARGGFSYHRTEQQLLEWMAVPPEVKLRWIEETNHFICNASPEGIGEIRDQIRRGKI